MWRAFIPFVLAMAFIGIDELEAQECERLYPKGLNQACRSAQTPTVERVSLEAVAVTQDNAPQEDYCRLDAVVHGDLTSLTEAVRGNKVQVVQMWLQGPDEFDRYGIKIFDFPESDMRTSFTESSDFFGRYPDQYSRHKSDNALSYAYLKNRGVPEGLAMLQKVESLYAYVEEADTGYSWDISIQPPRESLNLQAIYSQCIATIELDREKVRRQQYVTKHQVAIESARQIAEAEIAFLTGEIEFMETAIEELQSAIVQAEAAIDEALLQRRGLIVLEATFGSLINAFWSNISTKYNTFYEWASERLQGIDQQLAEAEQHKAEIEQIEATFQQELADTRQRAREKQKELEELGNPENEQ